MYPASLSRFNQYCDSRHSLYATDSLAENPALDIAPFDSEMLAAMDVPARSCCLDGTTSRLSTRDCWQVFTIPMANW